TLAAGCARGCHGACRIMFLVRPAWMDPPPRWRDPRSLARAVYPISGLDALRNGARSAAPDRPQPEARRRVVVDPSRSSITGEGGNGTVARRHDRAPGAASALSQPWHFAYREAESLASADACRAIMLAFVAAALLVPLLRQMAPGTAAAR